MGVELLFAAQRSGLLLEERQLEKLEEEIRTRKCALQENNYGHIERVVFVSVLRLLDSHGKILVQVGKHSDQGMVACCRLPGTKRRTSELPQDCVQRLLSEDLGPLAPGVELTHSSREVEILDRDAPKASYRIATRYLRTIHAAMLRDDFQVPQLPTVRTKADGTQSSSDRYTSALHLTSVVMIGAGKNAFLYCWLAPDVYELLSSEEGEDTLRSWFSTLDTSHLRIGGSPDVLEC